MKILIFLLLTFSFSSLLDNKKYNIMNQIVDDEHKNSNFFQLKNNYLTQIMNVSINEVINNLNQKFLDDHSKCITSINEIYNTNQYIELYTNTGKEINNIGESTFCQNHGNKYIFLKFNRNFLDNKTESNYYDFITMTEFYSGICSIQECDNTIKDLFNNNLNNELISYLSRTYGIENIKVYTEEDKIFDSNKTEFQIIYYLFIGYFFFRFFITLIGYYIFIKDFSQYENDRNDLLNVNNNLKSKKKKGFYRLYKLFSLMKGLKYIFGADKNQIYNQKDTQYICGTKCFLTFFFTLNIVYQFMMILPHSLYDGEKEFISSFWMIIIKLSTFCSQCITCINGILMTFKLMNYIKKYNKYSIDSFFYFSIGLIIKVYSFYFIFYILYLNVDQYTDDKFSHFDYFKNEILFKNRDCYINPLKILIPFYYQYFNTIEQENTEISFDKCFRCFFYLQSEFYCFIFSLTIFYFIFKFKSKIFEFFVLFALVVSTILTFLNYKNYVWPKNFTMDLFFGENFSIKKPHIIFPSYFLGNIAGVTYFYYCDTISTRPLLNNDSYMPFIFVYNMIKSYDQLKTILKILITYSFLIICLVLCSIYSLLIYTSENFTIELVGYLKFLFMYDKIIFNFCFLFLLLCLVGFRKRVVIRQILSFNLFIVFDKFSSIYLLCIEFFAYLFFGLGTFEIYINIKNIFLLSLGLFLIFYFLSALMAILIETPFRVILKLIVRKRLKSKNI